MGRLEEFRNNWRALLAAFLGLSFGSSLTNFTLSLFGPEMVRAFGWTSADFALVGTLPLLTLILIPLVGRFTDQFGARFAATIGFCGVVPTIAALSFMEGSRNLFLGIMFLHFLLGSFTTPLVFCRALVQRFDRSRGLALSLAMTGAPLVGAIAIPLLGQVIVEHDWRVAYRALAIACAFGGLCAVALLPSETPTSQSRADRPALSLAQLADLFRSPSLRLILAGIFLINLPQVIGSSQLKLVLLWTGIADSSATWLLSVYAGGVVIGRFATGLALDRRPAHLVALVVLGLPAAGLGILATSSSLLPLVTLAVLLIGLAQGGEGDVGAYMVSRRFGFENYSLILGLVTASLGAATALGSLLFSYSLDAGASYALFLVLGAAVTVVGALAFFATGFSGSRAEVAAKSLT